MDELLPSVLILTAIILFFPLVHLLFYYWIHRLNLHAQFTEKPSIWRFKLINDLLFAFMIIFFPFIVGKSGRGPFTPPSGISSLEANNYLSGELIGLIILGFLILSFNTKHFFKNEITLSIAKTYTLLFPLWLGYLGYCFIHYG